MALELADKVERIPGAAPVPSGDGSAVVEVPAASAAYRGLIALGFTAKEAEDALAAIDTDLPDEDLLRAALNHLRG